MDYEFRELTEVESEISRQIIAIEQEAFGAGGMNEWFLPPFIRRGRVFVLLDRGIVAAVAEYMRDWDDPAHAYLFGCAVKKDYRGKGLGKRLMIRSLECLARDGFKTVSLTVDPENMAAMRLYTGLGFTQAAFYKDEYGPNHDRLLMIVKLPVEEACDGV